MNKIKATAKHIAQGEKAEIFSICLDNNVLSEFEKFMVKFKDDEKHHDDFMTILKALTKIMENGALERLFRPEGKYSDNVCALPIQSGKLRLY